jgi:flagellar basal-body rod protein FlgC
MSRMRAEVVAANMANAETTRTARAALPPPARGLCRQCRAIRISLDSMSTASEPGGRRCLPLPALLPPLHVAGFRAAVAPGVHIAQVVEDPSPPLKRYDPGHPDAGPDGYVSYPDINPLTEMVDLMGATRAYGLNSSAVQAEKGMIASALEIAKS